MVGRTNMHFARQPSFSNTFSCFSLLASICMIRSKYKQFGNTSIWPYPCGVLDSFTVPLHSSNGSCARGLSLESEKNSGNSHWVHELIMQFSCRQSQSIFRLTNYKSVMLSNKVLEAMSHIPLTFLLPPG